MAAYRVASLEPPAPATATPFVGRDEELGRLGAVYEAAVAAPAARLAVLLGSPGLGKSRLIDEFARRRGEAATVLTAACDAAGGATFAPLAEALRELLAIGGADPTDPSDRSAALRAALEAAIPADAAERRTHRRRHRRAARRLARPRPRRPSSSSAASSPAWRGRGRCCW